MAEKVDLQERGQWPRELPGRFRPDRCQEPGFLQHVLVSENQEEEWHLKETKVKQVIRTGPVKIRVLTSEDGFAFSSAAPKLVWPIHKLTTLVERRIRALIAALFTQEDIGGSQRVQSSVDYYWCKVSLFWCLFWCKAGPSCDCFWCRPVGGCQV